MRDMLALLLAFSAFAACADSVDPCTGQTTSAPVWTPPSLNQPLTCERETGRAVNFNAKGAAAWRYCWNGSKFYPQTIAAPWADFQAVPGMALDIVQAGFNANNATIQRLLLKYSTGSFIDAEHAAVWCPFRAQIVAGIPPAPVVPAWVTSGMTTYRFTGSALGGVAGATPLGQPCDCAKPYMLGSATYCPLQGGAVTTVARCKRP